MKLLPFTPGMEALVRSGYKTATTRTRRYGDPGDEMVTKQGVRLLLVEVEKVRLDVVRDCYWREEGCDSPEDFERVWEAIHPLRGYVPDQMVYLHQFQVLSDDRKGDSA